METKYSIRKTSAALCQTLCNSPAALDMKSQETQVSSENVEESAILDLENAVISVRSTPAKSKEKGFFIMPLRRCRDIISSCVRCELCEFPCKVVSERDVFDVSLKIVCTKCSCIIYSDFPASILMEHYKKPLSEVNMVMAYQSVIRDNGLADCRKAASAFGMSNFTDSSYKKYIRLIKNKLLSKYNESLQETHRAIVKYYESLDIWPDENGILNISFGFDYKLLPSQYTGQNVGLCILVEAKTGLVVDGEVFWSFDSSPVADLWKRSSDIGFRYSEYVIDGDKDNFCLLQDIVGTSNMYKNIYFQKINGFSHACNHFLTRLTTLSAKLIEEDAENGFDLPPVKRTVAGSCTQLSEKVIQIFVEQFRRAIRANLSTDATRMAHDIMAVFYHSSSTKSHPFIHTFCPKGEDSWCFNEETFAPDNSSDPYAINAVRLKLSETQYQALEAVFLDISNVKLLQRLLRSNATFHVKLVAKCFKSLSSGHGYNGLKITMMNGIMNYNNKSYSEISFLTDLEI